ncbi:bifunctional serine/threonine-protein kinase/formylglycine-generating enzyme family protein [Nannocystis radixulma]|uniref:Bifunctional serine/threonine-protein kinase/formylglycine-generating enzyme family protein n=2 Tax=Nannocystis TaxID=53 RepID=A0ABT5AZP5_9BACT|nr:bifunctional serine/threonine-protein kinase/formylglycine-generating enzyme family protein [Nannocystis radixulma]MDC0667310.1 bifunctional serine/threonine-protein kinase/formylglycine-generating enzyme family protein [Nannocystis radixulma]
MAEAGDRFGLVGTLVADKYFIERVVGEGGFGIVYRAVHRIWDEPVAVKCFTALSNAPVEMREELLEQFVREGKLLTALSSRTTGIVQARDIGTLTTPNGVWLPYMVLEWLDGRPLESWIGNDEGRPRSSERSPLETFNLMDGCARALALAHGRGVAHRDIKPANFFVLGGELAPGVVIKVLDFGIAKVMQSQASTAMQATGTQISSFTPTYGAPEQFDRSYGATGPWTDVYQMALVLVEIMRGGLPALEGEQFIQFAFATQNTQRRPTPRTFGVATSDAVEAVFQKALAVRVVDRYPNMGEFWTNLAVALELREYPAIQAAETAIGQTVVPDGSGGLKTRRSGELLAQAPVMTMSTPAAPTPASPPAPPTVVTPPAPTVKPMAAGAIAAIVGALVAVGAGVFVATRGGGEPEKPPTPPPQLEAKVVEPPKPETKVEPPKPPTSCPEGMAFVTGKNFFMGSESEKPVLALARPQHKVEIRPFCIDIYEVTTEKYEACSDKGDCKRAYRDSFWPQGASKRADWDKAKTAYSTLCNAGVAERKQHPINCITWAQADEYCRVQGKRLPSEAEFEFAARGSDGRVYPWGDGAPSPEHLNACGTECVAWRKQKGLPPVEPMYAADDKFVGTAPVGSFPGGKTENGLFDLVGNVFEWTADRFERYPTTEGEPPPPMPGNNRVIRGGAFNSSEPEHTDPALRFPNDADAHTHGIGFRCAGDPR